MARRTYEGSPEDMAADAAGQARMDRRKGRRSPHLRGNEDEHHVGSRDAINPMHRPGPQHNFGGHAGQTRGPATDGYPSDGEMAPPNSPGDGGNMGGY